MQSVCVLPKDGQDVLLGADHPLTASMQPISPKVFSPSVRAVTRMQKIVAENELAADIAADKEDVVNVTSLADGNDGESESEQVEPGSKEVESESPSTPGIVTCSSVNPFVDGAESADMAEELDEDDGEIASVLEE